MRGVRWAFVVLVGAAVLAATGCGGGGGGGDETSTTETTSTETTTSATGTTKLVATVGSESDHEAFEISLKTEDGADVGTLAPGNYTLEIKDFASTHNFHLTGPGVDEASDIGGTEDKTVDITLQDGSYHFQCDPHASSMNGDFTVSG